MNEMTYNEAIEWMDSRHWSGTGKGIVRSQELLERLGNPQDKLKFVHVAGTNGKGSVCACLSKILTAAGYQVGLFVSPHLKRFNSGFILTEQRSETKILRGWRHGSEHRQKS